MSHTIGGNGTWIRAQVPLYWGMTEWVSTLGALAVSRSKQHLQQALPGTFPNFCGKGDAAGKKVVTRRRSEGVETAAQITFISMMHPHEVMEPFITISHVIVSFIYASCFLEGQPKMVQTYAIMKYIKESKYLATVVLKPSNIINENTDLDCNVSTFTLSRGPFPFNISVHPSDIIFLEPKKFSLLLILVQAFR